MHDFSVRATQRGNKLGGQDPSLSGGLLAVVTSHKSPPGHVRPATHADRRSLYREGSGSPAVWPSALPVACRSDRTQRNCHLPQAGRWAECRRSRRARNVRGRRLVVTAPASSREAAAAIVFGFYRRRRASTRPGVALHGNSNNETIPPARHPCTILEMLDSDWFKSVHIWLYRERYIC